MNEADLLFMGDDAASASTENTSLPWTILIIDDDPQVHAATRLALLQDSVGRLGGEEFACLLPGITASQAGLTAEQLRAAVAEQKIVLADGRQTGVTISVGLALFAQGNETLDAVLSRADGALYLAKKHGRNCVRQN
jgi:diguanylate cyclase (GGDEF)-like protein